MIRPLDRFTRTYSTPYAGAWTSRRGASLDIRPIRPEDEPEMVRFHESLSEQSVYLRYFHHLPLSARITHERLTRICFADAGRETVLVAESVEARLVAVGRLSREQGSPSAEFALLVSDAWHGQGLGTELLRRLLSRARSEGIRCVAGDILAENQAMQNICRQLGFQLRYGVEDGVIKAALSIEPPVA